MNRPARWVVCGVIFASMLSCRTSSDVTTVHLQITPTAATLVQGDSLLLTVSALDANGLLVTGVSVRFTAKNPSLLAVTNLGWIKAIGASGTTAVTVNGGGDDVDVPVTILGKPVAIAIDPDPAVVPQKGTLQLTGTVRDLNGDVIPNAAVSYSVPLNLIVTAGSSGLLTSIGATGSTSINAFGGGISRQLTVTVNQSPGSISVPSALNLPLNATYPLGPQLLDLAGVPMAGGSFTYTSSDPSRVSVTSAGLVATSGTLGTALITVRSGSLTQTITVNVVAVSHPNGILTSPHVVVSGDPYGTAITGSIVWTGTLGGSIASFDLASPSNVSSIATGGQLTDIAASLDGRFVYGAGPSSGVAVVDATARSLLGTITGLSGTVFDVVVDPSGNAVYAATASGVVASLNPATRTITAQLTPLTEAGHLALHPSKPLLYVSGLETGKVVEINTSTWTMTRSFSTTGMLQAVAVAPDGSELYVANETAGNVAIVNLTTGAISAVPLPQCNAFGLVVTPDGAQLYIGCTTVSGNSAKVIVMDRLTHTITQTFAVGGDPRRMSISADGSTVAVANESGWVDIIR